VGDKYEPATPEAWRDLIAAAVTAGAKPTGAFSLRNGRVIVATFEVGESNGIRTYFVMVDSFDGSQKFRCGHTSVRVVCCNTLSAAIRSDGHGMAAFRHTSSIHDKIKALTASVGDAIKTGEKVKEMYHAAETFRMDRTNAEKAFDLLFPAAKEDATPNAKTRAENARAAGRIAAAMPINAAGNSLASLWNAATYLVDRTESGDARKLRGGNRLDSMLLGKRGEDVEEILLKIEMIMSNGEIQAMTVPDALASGANPATVGSDILQQMLADAE
jgi:hypothetical protein